MTSWFVFYAHVTFLQTFVVFVPDRAALGAWSRAWRASAPWPHAAVTPEATNQSCAAHKTRLIKGSFFSNSCYPRLLFLQFTIHSCENVALLFWFYTTLLLHTQQVGEVSITRLLLRTKEGIFQCWKLCDNLFCLEAFFHYLDACVTFFFPHLWLKLEVWWWHGEAGCHSSSVFKAQYCWAWFCWEYNAGQDSGNSAAKTITGSPPWAHFNIRQQRPVQ